MILGESFNPPGRVELSIGGAQAYQIASLMGVIEAHQSFLGEGRNAEIEIIYEHNKATHSALNELKLKGENLTPVYLSAVTMGIGVSTDPEFHRQNINSLLMDNLITPEDDRVFREFISNLTTARTHILDQESTSMGDYTINQVRGIEALQPGSNESEHSKSLLLGVLSAGWVSARNGSARKLISNTIQREFYVE